MFGRPAFTVNLGKLCWLTIGQKLTSAVLPPRCVLCSGPGQHGDELWGLDLCPFCEAALPRPGPLDPTPAGLNAARALSLYEDPVDRLITGLKFRGELAGARVLGTLLARHILAQDIRLPQVLVPMPLHAARYRERGFNQAEAIATQVASRTGVPLDPTLLLRVRATAPQTTLTAAERRSNCAGAFAVPPGRHAPARVALLDDVMTTGSTAAAAAEALRAAGARHVELWACAVAALGTSP
jgi:ComF family protein